MLLTLLKTRPILTASELRAAGIQPRDVIAAADRGEIVRPFPGVVVRPDVYADPDYDDAEACYRTGGVIGHLSAAMRHGLCDALPPRLEMLTAATVARPPSESPIRLIRSRNPEHVIMGVESRDFHGWQIRITTPARTVIDLHRLEPEATRQHAVTALARYVSEGHPVDELHRIASAFECWDTLRPEVEIALEARGGMKP